MKEIIYDKKILLDLSCNKKDKKTLSVVKQLIDSDTVVQLQLVENGEGEGEYVMFLKKSNLKLPFNHNL